MKIKSILSLFIIAGLVGCQNPGQQYEASSYNVNELNQRQEAKTIQIIAVLPAKVEVDNSELKNDATKFGALAGAIGGALIGRNQGEAFAGGAIGGVTGGLLGSAVSGKTLVDGVTITYSENNQIFTSTQVGRTCQFKPGTALVVIPKPNQTRVQPNATCPAQ